MALSPQNWLTRCLAAGCLLVAAPCPAQEKTSPNTPTVRVRCEWGNTTPQQWQGLLELSEGSFLQAQSLGLEADDAGSLWSDAEAVWIVRRTPRVYDGFDVALTAHPSARLMLTLQSGEVHERFETTVAAVCRESVVFPMGAHGASLVMSRTPGDTLRVIVDRSHVVYSPKERFVGHVQVAPITPHKQALQGTLWWDLCAARSGSVLNHGTRFLTLTSNQVTPARAPLDIPLPAMEGVYDIRIQFTAPRHPLLSTVVQVVVVDATPVKRLAALDDFAPPRLVDSFDPRETNLFRTLSVRNHVRLTELGVQRSLKKLASLLPPLAARAQTARLPTATSPADPIGSVNWKAYRLHVEHPGRAHRLNLSLVQDRMQPVGVSLLEPNAIGELRPVGLDTALLPSTPAPSLHTTSKVPRPTRNHYAIFFWPKVDDPVVLIHDLGFGQKASVDRVELYELSELSYGPQVSADSPTGPAHGADATSEGPTEHVSGPVRWVGPYMHRPLLPENFGDVEAYDAANRRSIDDWLTFHSAAVRLTDYVKQQGYNSLMIAAFADGSGIYPSKHLQMTPRYDTGLYAAMTQEPVRKDVLEMLFRLFDRAGLILVPELQFATPLPALEREVRQSTTDSSSRSISKAAALRGIELIGAEGQSWREAHPGHHGRAPYYNPLNDRVQTAILDVVRELVERYGSHQSFRGLSLELSSDGYLQLPGLNWGYDDDTVSRFERDTGIRLPTTATSGDNRFHQRYAFLTTQARHEWIGWRCRTLAEFHRRIADAAVVQPTDRLILASNRLLRNTATDSDVTRILKTGGRYKDVLAAQGLDFQQYADLPSVVVLRPVVSTITNSPLNASVDVTLNTSLGVDQLFTGPQRGSLFYQLPYELRIADFDAVSPWQPAFTWLACHALQAGPKARQSLVHALAAYDASVLFAGGWMIPPGQDASLGALVRTVRAIPSLPFQLCAEQEQPAIVRIARDGKSTYVYVVNDFFGAADVRLQIACPRGTRIHELGSSRARRIGDDVTKVRRIHLDLRPYDLWACRIESTRARVTGVQASVDRDAWKELEQRVRTVEDRLTEIQRSQESTQVAFSNSGFEMDAVAPESEAAEGLADWSVPVQQAALWTLDSTEPHSGRRALLLDSAGSAASVLSAAFPLEGHRQVTANVWLRSEHPAAAVRFSLEDAHTGAVQRQSSDMRVETRWRRFAFLANDIPADSVETARVRITFLGPGKLWIDDVDIQLKTFSDDETRQLTKSFSAIAFAWEEDRYADCARLLDSYWAQYVLQTTAKPVAPASRAMPRSRPLLRWLDKYRGD